MPQNALIALPPLRHTRADFTALRAYLNRLPMIRIAALYYSEDDLTDRGPGAGLVETDPENRHAEGGAS